MSLESIIQENTAPIKGHEAVRAILLRFDRTRLSEFETSELSELIQTLEA